MTPFGRQPVTAGLLATHALAEGPAPQITLDKWALLRDLTTARTAFGVSDRDLGVLSALLSFHPRKELSDNDGLIVFPSNASLSDRAHGMAESTLRRHLAALVRAGLILRRDSPNGKRYARRGPSGVQRAFGFDLRPLLMRSEEIAEAAAEARQRELKQRLSRETVVLHLRDTAKLITWGRENVQANWDELSDLLALIQRHLRRKLQADELAILAQKAHELLARAKELIIIETPEMVAYDGQNERHQQSSKPDSSESESCQEKQKTTTPAMPLSVVLKATPEMCGFAPDEIRNWSDLVRAADFIRPMLGITPEAWHQSAVVMGRETAAVVLACILQRARTISNPGGYLRALTSKAAEGGFSAGPMVMALIRSEGRPS